MCTEGRAGRCLKESQSQRLCGGSARASLRTGAGDRADRGDTGGRPEAAEQAVQEARVMWLMGQQGE